MTMKIMVTIEDQQGVQENAEELQEDCSDHVITDKVMTISDLDVEGIGEDLGNIHDCTLESKQRP